MFRYHVLDIRATLRPAERNTVRALDGFQIFIIGLSTTTSASCELGDIISSVTKLLLLNCSLSVIGRYIARRLNRTAVLFRSKGVHCFVIEAVIRPTLERGLSP